MLIGYARNNHSKANIDLQVSELETAGCQRIWKDLGSGADGNRQGLNEMLSLASSGDTIMVTHLDRFARSHQHIVPILKLLEERSIAIRTLDGRIDTSTVPGRRSMNLIARIA